MGWHDAKANDFWAEFAETTCSRKLVFTTDGAMRVFVMIVELIVGSPNCAAVN